MGTYSALSATELDSHANMAVAGIDCTIISNSGTYADVTPFSTDLPVMKLVEIVDAMFAYDDPFTLTTYLLVMRNALHIPSMHHNLIPPFLMQEAGLLLDETPKFQLEMPTIDNHAIVDIDTGMQIHLKLNGIFSYFTTRNLIKAERDNWETYPIVFLTPDGDSWNPDSDHFAEQEDAMLDPTGSIAECYEHPPKRLFTEADLGELYALPATWDQYDAKVDLTLSADDPFCGMTLTEDEASSLCHDGIRAQLSSLHVAHDPALFAGSITERTHASHAAMVMGSTTIDNSSCNLFVASAPSAFASAFSTLAAVTAGRAKGVSAEHLAKVWMIPHEEAARTLKVTSQRLRTDIDSSLSRNFGTNDRAVRYRHIKSCFYTDTLFVTGAAKSTRGNICAQLFVSDKGYVAIYPMQHQRDYFLALKQFAKDVGAPDVLVCDPHPTQKQRKVKEFCTQIGTTLKVLEAQTQWANRAELYIGLIKEATRKDMRASGSALVLWDYCMERRALIYQVTAKNLFQLNGTTPHTFTFGTDADISNLCRFGWYEWIYFRENSASFPFQKERLGRCLGPAWNEGNAMSQWVLKDNGKVVSR